MKLRSLKSAKSPLTWCTIGLLGVLLVVPLPLGEVSACDRALRDALHFPIFAILLLLLYAGLKGIRPAAGRRALLPAILLAVTLGAASEWAQNLGSRTSSWHDLVNNMLGVLAGSATIIASRFRGRSRFPWVVAAAAAIWITTTLVVARPWIAAREARQRQASASPQLGDFEETWESLVWIPQGEGGPQPTRATITDSHQTRGARSLEVKTVGSSWAGVRVLLDPSLSWQGSQSLRFDVINPEDEFELGIRVDAPDGRRFSGRVSIKPGLNHCRVPPDSLVDGRLNMSEATPFPVNAVVFHLGQPPATRRFYLDNVSLE